MKKSTRSNAASSKNSDMPPSTRQNSTHIFFWGGPLSNWHVGRHYSGERAFELLLSRLTELHVSHPGPDAFSSRLLRSTNFGCGEQWMMALKGWFFERDIELSEKLFAGGEDSDEEFAALRTEMLDTTRPSLSEKKKRDLYDSCLCKCLRSKLPKEQKGHGRRCRNFDLQLWDIVSIPVVVSCLIARAEADDVLRILYMRAGSRAFVEGSPTDTIWGVGIHWGDAKIDNESNWRGANKLGICHGIACKEVQAEWEDKLSAPQVAGS
jgi:ribA/ribD-fused uncharacterized protein